MFKIIEIEGKQYAVYYSKEGYPYPQVWDGSCLMRTFFNEEEGSYYSDDRLFYDGNSKKIVDKDFVKKVFDAIRSD